MDGSRVALVVANDRYDDPGLRQLVAPAQDATALADVLADPSVGGFEVQVVRNASAQDIRYAVEDFFADRRPEDLLLLHFSCHGLKNSAGELYLAVADTKPNRLASTAVPADFVNRQMADSRAQRIALFLDCCYGGAFPRGMVVRAAGEAQVQDAFARQAEVGGGRGRVVITASSAMEYAFEGSRLASDATPAPSVFTGAVVDGLTTGEADRDGDGWVGLTELVGFVADRVHRVTPNQNPQMWTFGSQGELLIARSKVRRVTAARLAPELVQAMESPLPAARFGVVDYLRERLSDAELAQAYAAWQALQRMVGDDSRKVSEAAADALATATRHITPEVLELTEGTAGELQLAGSPLALTASASASTSWLQLERDDRTIRVHAKEPPPGDHEAVVTLSGPLGEHTVPIHLTTSPTAPSKPTTASKPTLPSRPAAASMPTTLSSPVASEPTASSKIAESVKVVAPWWLIGVLIAGAATWIVLGRPGNGYRSLWYDHDNTGWVVYRSWGDPVMLSSYGVLLAALAARRVGQIALGVAVGGAAYVLASGLLILAAGLAWDGTGTWIAVTLTAGVLVALLLVRLWPGRWPLLPVPPIAAGLVVAGGILLLISSLIEHPNDGLSFFDVTGLAVVEPVVPLALGWLALAATTARTWLVAAATTYVLISVVAAVPALTSGDSPAAFLSALFGNLLIGVAVVSRVQRVQSRP
ncbi:MAG TPA: caspase family protein [Kribbella sp.]|nr:caspase family protein [Kribbella sp.]